MTTGLSIRHTLASFIAVFVAWVFAASCEHDHSHGGHEGDHAPHGDPAGHGDSGGDLPALSVTIWAPKTELFMEYEPLVVNRPSRFAAHLTTMRDFKAVTSGVLEMTLRSADGKLLAASADGPSSPGIFRFALTPKEAGTYKVALAYAGQGITDAIVAGNAVIHPNLDAARRAAPAGEDGGIAYTKEQQWKTDFATVVVSEHALQPSVRAVGEVRPVSGREAKLTAPARGRITLATPTPLPGIQVKKGQLLATVSPYLAAGGDRSSLEAEQRSAQAEHTAAVSQLGRLERLLAEQAVPERRVEDARAMVSVAFARLEAASGRLQQYSQGAAGIGGRSAGAFQLRSAIDGTLVEVNATTGDGVEEGELLFVIIDVSRIWLVAKVFEPDIPKAEAASAAWFKLEGYEQPFTIDESNGRVVTVGRVLDPKSRTVPVIFEMDNPGDRIRIGQFAEVFIATGKPQARLAIPATALLDDGGRPIVFVQIEGESFERRVLVTGIRSKGLIEVTAGVQGGERVVTRGAYEVRLAAASGAIPEHGHVH
jgi:RND family efflux transporter MFP subunit